MANQGGDDATAQRQLLSDTDKKPRKVLGLYVKIIVGGKDRIILIDTGASVSIIENHALVDMFKISGKKIELHTASETNLKTLGVANVPFQLGEENLIHEFHVVDKLTLPGVSVILGLDYISDNLLVIDGRSEGVTRVFLNEKELEVVGTCGTTTAAAIRDGVKPIVGVLGGETVLPEASLKNIKVYPSSHLPEGQNVIIEPFAKYSDFILGGVSVMHEGEIAIPCVNFSKRRMLLDNNNICNIIPCERVEGFDVRDLESRSTAESNKGQIAAGLVASTSREERVKEIIQGNTPQGLSKYIEGLIEKFSDVVALDNEPPGRVSHSHFRIATGDSLPIQSRPYRIPVSNQQVVQDEIDKLESQGIIRKSMSPWSSPIVLVRKKDGSPRLCVDYRKLNSITKDDKFPLPSIEELLVKVREGKFFSTIDLKSGYHQIPVHPDDREKTAFICDNALYEYLYLPFGVKNAPSHFSRVMMAVLNGLIGNSVLVYLDDLIVLGKDPEEHLSNLAEVLSALGRQGMRINLNKCKFFQSEVNFLGHKVSQNGIEPCIDKVKAIHEYPTPKSSKDVASFLGMAGYYRKFIRGFGEIARPLEALKKKGNFKWEEAQEEAFRKLKSMMSGDQVLAYPRFDRPFLVTTDASNLAIGGVISQVDDEGKERPICFASRALKGAELNYSVLDKEALGVIFLIERHRYILLGHRIHIKSDHRPLRELFNKASLNSRQSRWIERLLEFDIEGFDHIEGKLNKVADALSRHACGVITRAMKRREIVAESRDGQSTSSSEGDGNRTLSPEAEGGERRSSTDVSVNDVRMGTERGGAVNESPLNESMTCIGWNEEELKVEQEKEGWIREVREYVMGKSTRFPEMLKVARKNFVLEEGILYLKTEKRQGQIVFRVVLPKSLHERALKLIHACPFSGHMGVDRTWRKARDAYFWVGLRPTIKDFIDKCHECSCAKSHPTVCPEGRRWPIVPKKFFRVHMDLVGPFPESSHGHKYVCVLVDAFTRYTFVYAMLDKSAKSVANAIHYFVMKFGCPGILISDNGREFVNEIIEGLTKLMGIEHFTIQSYRPSANGLVESHNRGIVQLLRLVVGDNPGNWVHALQPAEFALNTAFNRSIQDTPYYLVFGQDPVLPYSVVSRERDNPVYNIEDYKVYLNGLTKRVFKTTEEMLKRAGDEYKRDYDAREKVGVAKIKEGDRVYLRRLQPRKHKLEPHFVGPYRVKEVDGNKAKMVHLGTGKQVEYHLSHILKRESEVTREENENVGNPFPGIDDDLGSMG